MTLLVSTSFEELRSGDDGTLSWSRRECGWSSRRLLAAIISRSVIDFALYKDYTPEEDKLRHHLAVEAAGWLFFDGTESIDEQGRYSFLWICSSLGLNPADIRRQALLLTRDEVRRRFSDAKD